MKISQEFSDFQKLHFFGWFNTTAVLCQKITITTRPVQFLAKQGWFYFFMSFMILSHCVYVPCISPSERIEVNHIIFDLYLYDPLDVGVVFNDIVAKNATCCFCWWCVAHLLMIGLFLVVFGYFSLVYITSS